MGTWLSMKHGKWTWACGSLPDDSDVRFNTALYEATAAIHKDKRGLKYILIGYFNIAATVATVHVQLQCEFST